MQATLRSATRRAVAISSRHGVATTTTAATASKDWLGEHEKAWVKAMVQREVRAQMVAEEERRITLDRLRAAEEECRITRDRLRTAAEEKWPTTCLRCRLADDALFHLWFDFTLAVMKGCAIGAGLSLLVYGRVF